jgi:hypothetical protein
MEAATRHTTGSYSRSSDCQTAMVIVARKMAVAARPSESANVLAIDFICSAPS